MSVALAPGYPDYSSTADSSNYIPTLFAKETLVKYYATSVIPAISNTDYEGDIKKGGDEVKIRTVPTITVTDGAKGKTLNYETLESDSISLLIDKEKNYAFVITDVDAKQSDIVLAEKFTAGAAKDMKVQIDTDVLAAVPSSAHASNQGSSAGAVSADINLGVSGTPKSLTSDNITDFIVDCQTVLTEQNTPDDGMRFFVLPVWACGLINKSDLSNSSFSGQDMSQLLKRGYQGTIAGFDIYCSNLIDTTSDGGGTTAFSAVFGHRDALTFATQLTRNRSMELEGQFGIGYSGQYVFGYKVVKPEAFGWAYVDKG